MQFPQGIQNSMLSSEIRVSRIGSIPFMKNKGCDSFDLRNHIFMSEIFSHLQRCYLHSFCFKKMTDFAADKSILIKIAFLPYPRNIRFPGEIHKALASYSHTIADTAYISVNIPISCRIPRLGKGGVRAGSINDPEEYTGLAHYLEHVMFKGTDKIGALNWTEEEPIYKEIIAKYDQMAEEADPAKKEAISKEINELTVKAGKLGLPNEYSNLMESMGAKGVNAGTYYDWTFYHSSFPAYQINKWLEISSQRFLHPVFRSFQSELENVYEEYNRSQDDQGRAQNQFVMEKAFEGHPYSRSIIGLPEHLKNPRLSKLIEFYEQWYVPENMVLVLVGNIKAQQISGRINAAFGRLAAKPSPERKVYQNLEIMELYCNLILGFGILCTG